VARPSGEEQKGAVAATPAAAAATATATAVGLKVGVAALHMREMERGEAPAGGTATWAAEAAAGIGDMHTEPHSKMSSMVGGEEDRRDSTEDSTEPEEDGGRRNAPYRKIRILAAR
jgi:hypothetical protein